MGEAEQAIAIARAYAKHSIEGRAVEPKLECANITKGRVHRVQPFDPDDRPRYGARHDGKHVGFPVIRAVTRSPPRASLSVTSAALAASMASQRLATKWDGNRALLMAASLRSIGLTLEGRILPPVAEAHEPASIKFDEFAQRVEAETTIERQ